MSNAAMAWAFAQDLPSSEKFVLVAVADWAADREVFASVGAIARKTGLNEKTVRACMKRLVASGHLHPTNERRGRTKQIVVYEISFSEDLFRAILPAAKAPESGSLPKTDTLAKKGGKASQIREGEDSQNWEGEDSQNWETDTKGDTKQENNNNRSGEEKSGKGAASSVESLIRQCLQLAGIPDVPLPDGRAGKRWREAAQCVADWLEAGGDADLILGAIEAGRHSATDGVHSLRYFDLSVRKRIARQAARGVSYEPSPTAQAEPDVAEDGCDEARQIKMKVREAMARQNGSDASWAAWVAPLRFEIKGDDLLLKTDSAFRADWVRNNLAGVIGRVADPLAVRVVAA